MNRPRWLTLGRAGMVAALVLVWTLLWGEVSVPNVVSGLVVAVGLLIVFPLEEVEHVDHRIHPVGVIKLTAYFFYELVVSTVSVARDVIIGPSRVRTAVVACPLRVDADGLITFMANIIALSPGTLAIHETRDPLVIYIHVLKVRTPDDVRRWTTRLETLAVGALGSPAMIEACKSPPPTLEDLGLA